MTRWLRLVLRGGDPLDPSVLDRRDPCDGRVSSGTQQPTAERLSGDDSLLPEEFQDQWGELQTNGSTLLYPKTFFGRPLVSTTSTTRPKSPQQISTIDLTGGAVGGRDPNTSFGTGFDDSGIGSPRRLSPPISPHRRTKSADVVLTPEQSDRWASPEKTLKERMRQSVDSHIGATGGRDPNTSFVSPLDDSGMFGSSAGSPQN